MAISSSNVVWTDVTTANVDVDDGWYGYTISADQIVGNTISVGTYLPIIKHEEVFEMQVYDVIVVDTKECEVLHRQQVIAEDEKAAMLELDITDEMMPHIKKQQ